MENSVRDHKEQGNVPILAAMMLIFLIGAGLAYMKWSADEGVENRYERAAIQATYLAQTGISERGFAYLRSLEPGNLPVGRVDLSDGGIPDVGQYLQTYVMRDPEHSGGSVWNMSNYYNIYSTGVVRFQNSRGEDISVRRTRNLKVRIRSLNAYMYLTDLETTIFGEVIKFWSPDTLFGRVHSNDQIAIREHPVFYGLVSTCAEDFWHGPGYDPEFVNIDPVFNAIPVLVPSEATKVRACAGAAGLSFDGENTYVHKIVFEGQNGVRIYKFEIGTPETDSLIFSSGPLFDQAIFVFGPAELEGRVYGSVTVGASEDIRLIDNIWYDDSYGNGVIDSNTTNMLGIVSEGNIIVADTWENGRFNKQAGRDIFINAAMIALGESFTFEDQNDDWELYQGPMPDERGSIRLWGSVAQKRRGYVHRSNHSGTGYGKEYHFDERFLRNQPPCYPDATDLQGHALFDVIAWGVDNQ
jgi:hypothetical protein